MATSSNKSVTLQQRFGFQDHELKTPEHDNIMVWLDGHVEAWVLGRYSLEWKQKEIAEGITEMEKRRAEVVEVKRRELEKALLNLQEEQAGSARMFGLEYRQSHVNECTASLKKAEEWKADPPPKRVSVESKIWESPVMSGKYMVGFIDMLVQVGSNTLWRNLNDQCISKLPEWIERFVVHAYLFEVKPSISSVGEVVRQIRMYEQYQPGTYVVVSPDDRFAGILKNQGIEFLKATL